MKRKTKYLRFINDKGIYIIRLPLVQSAAGINALICFFFMVIGSMLFVNSTQAKDGINGNLVDVNWLEKSLNNDGVLILDTSPAQLYRAKHISS